VQKRLSSNVLLHLALILLVIAAVMGVGYLLGYRSGGAEWGSVGMAIALIPGSMLLLGYVIVHGMRHGIRPPLDQQEIQDGGKNPDSPS
jgi:hypothetical protein